MQGWYGGFYNKGPDNDNTGHEDPQKFVWQLQTGLRVPAICWSIATCQASHPWGADHNFVFLMPVLVQSGGRSSNFQRGYGTSPAFPPPTRIHLSGD